MTMTWSEQDINGLNPWVEDLTANNLDSDGITKAYGRGYTPQILIKSIDTNWDIIYISENSGDPASKQYPLLPWKTLTMDFSVYVATMNEFFVTGTAGDLLSVIVR